MQSKLLSFGTLELSFFTQDKKSGIGGKSKARLAAGDLIIDLKTTGEGGKTQKKHKKTIANPITIYKLHITSRNGTGKRIQFIFVEKVYPFAVGIYKLDKDALLENCSLREQALKEISLCHTDNYWRGYP